MSAPRSVYPPSPDCVPAELTQISGAYRLHAILLVGLIALFVILYLGLFFLSLYLLWLGITLPVRRPDVAGGIILKIFLIPTGLVLFLFLLRGFFRSGRKPPSMFVEIFLEDHPKLEEFVRRLCKELGAPLPYRLFVSYEVNASAMHEPTVWNLFVPGKKNLHIGLGLVNFLNLSEFKAVLAHEFGHICQKSMGLGNYVYFAQYLIANMLLGRDFLDDLLARGLRRDDGWRIVALVVWSLSEALRYTFYGLFIGLFLLDKALSRQMEFHADRIAVSVAGSDAMVHSLKRSMFAGEAMLQAMNDLNFVAKRGRYTSDVFEHQKLAAEYLRKQAEDPTLGEPPPPPKDPRGFVEVFSPDDEVHYPTMWADHPPNYLREDNAKVCYIRCEADPRSPWMLFEDAEEMRSKATYRMYRTEFRVPKDMVLSDPADVTSYVSEEHPEREFDKRYHGLYDNRNINPGDVPALIREAETSPGQPEEILAAHAQLYGDSTRAAAERYKRLLKELGFLQDVISKREDRDQDREFKFRGEYYRGRQAKKLLKRVGKDIEEQTEAFAPLDRTVFLVHYRMALTLGANVVRELKTRYAFHLSIQGIWSALHAQVFPIDVVLRLLDTAGGPSMTEEDFLFARDTLAIAHQVLSTSLRDAREINVPELKNLPAGEQLNRVLLQGNLVDGLVAYDYMITNKWIRKFLNQFEEVHGNLDRLHFKSLDSLLKLQEAISRQFQERFVRAAQAIE